MENKDQLVQEENVAFEEMEKAEEFGNVQDFLTGVGIGVGVVAGIVAIAT
ncbi:MAG: hypothetical protein IKL04_02260 [Lachnospiraceae bacterium]|nr:hypothetical protein [Lachnospiraceae bacterium]